MDTGTALLEFATALVGLVATVMAARQHFNSRSSAGSSGTYKSLLFPTIAIFAITVLAIERIPSISGSKASTSLAVETAIERCNATTLGYGGHTAAEMKAEADALDQLRHAITLDPEVVVHLRRVYKDSGNPSRDEITTVIGDAVTENNHTNAQLTTLLSLALQDKSSDVRRRAVAAIAQISSPSAEMVEELRAASTRERDKYAKETMQNVLASISQ